MRTLIKICIKSFMLLALLIVMFLPKSTMAGNYTIEHYDFGEIVVDGKTYKNDIVIFPDGSIQPGPDDMHYVLLPEIEDLINTPGLKTLVVGTGMEGNGMLRKKVIKAIKDKGIKLEMMLTKDAMKMLNQMPKEGLVAMLHLNC